jgi:hypothetical protein
VIKRYRERAEELLGRIYNEGYKRGVDAGKGELDNLRSEVFLEAGENDTEYAFGWNDYTLFYGWCGACHRPISGRWAHVAEYCQWCGAKINHEKDPYPSGLRNISKPMKEIEEMCADINPEEIMSHDTEDRLKSWCDSWNRQMTRLIRRISESEDGDE